MIALVLLIVALVLFIIAAIGVVTGKFSLVAAGLAFLTGAFIAQHFGV
jgi:hypothetical protein